MLVLHAAFGPSGVGDSGQMLLWGEEPTVEGNGRPERPGARFRSHPTALASGHLRTYLAGLGLNGALSPDSRVLLLPSPGAVVETNGHGPAATLIPLRVAGLAVPLPRAIEWLAGLPDPESSRAPAPNGDSPNGHTALGADLRYWAASARFVLDLLARGLIIPTVDRRPDGDMQAVWRPLLTGTAERRRLRALAEAMPPACRAVLGVDGFGGEPPPPLELLQAFLRAAVDELARTWLAETSWPEARWMLRHEAAPGGARWLEALAARPEAARLSARRSGALGDEVSGWTASLLGAQTVPFRVCLRLLPPGTDPTPAVGSNGHADGAAASVRPSRWRLEYLLQASDDPSLLVPAGRVWATDAAVARLAGREIAEPQEALLGELARASAVFGPIAASLTQARPTGADLTTEEAYAFLREAAPRIEELGVGVLVPVWWSRRGTRRRLGLRLALRPTVGGRSGSGGGSGTGLGLQALVEYDWRVALGDEELSHEEFERLAAMKVPLVQVRGEWVELRPEHVEQALRFFRGRGGGPAGGAGALSPAQAVRLALGGDETGLPVEGVEADGWLTDALRPRADFEAELAEPPGFVGELRPYQRRGYAWLVFMRQHGLGACLADDMGLGKTIQTIALLLHEKEQPELATDASAPALLVCPTSVLGNWVRELGRFAPGLRVLVHHGPDRPDEASFAAAAAAHDVVLTTYALVHRDESRLGQVDWAGVVLDEAQNVKNPGARSSRAVRRLRAGYRISLTGTPVENRLGELWSLCEFLNPGYLGSFESFKRRFAVPIEREGNAERAEELRRLIGPFVLRRLKSDPTILRDLPEKLEIKTYPPLTKEQATLYEAVVQDMLQKVAAVEGTERRGLILATLTKLKQVCNHPAHFLGDGSAMANRSGKLSRLEEMLEEALAAGDQVLIFTQFAEFGARLRTHLQARLDREVLYLHGGTPAPDRDRLVARFQSPDGPGVFVLSLRAGGVGLNLTRANRVVHFDRWWNPAVEAQATDRAYRIGQTRAVQVHTFISAGTLEERIDELIESKRALAESVIGGGEAWLTELTTDELRHLLTLRHTVIADA